MVTCWNWTLELKGIYFSFVLSNVGLYEQWAFHLSWHKVIIPVLRKKELKQIIKNYNCSF